MRVEKLSDDVTLYCGDSLKVMAELEANSVDSVITDPPYGLQFMGKEWDRGVPGIPFWEQALRVSKPGAMLLSFGGTRTYHRLASAIEDAGWEIRDMVSWIYGQGFPKSHDISKAIDKAAGAERDRPVIGKNPAWRPNEYTWNQGGGKTPMRPENKTSGFTPEAQLWDGWGTALKPAVEPICLAMKPIEGTYAENALKWDVAGLNIDGGRVGTEGGTTKGNPPKGKSNGIYGNGINGACDIVDINKGRWPANLIHDGSDEVVSLFPETKSGGANGSRKSGPYSDDRTWSVSNTPGANVQNGLPSSSGSAARFFYCAKASRAERNAGLEGMEEKQTKGGGGMNNTLDDVCGKYGSIKASAQNHHPTVKPVALMEYLAKLTKTPTGGVVIDPFIGSGTTGIACVKLGRPFIGIELDEDYFEIAKRRILHAMKQPRLEI